MRGLLFISIFLFVFFMTIGASDVIPPEYMKKIDAKIQEIMDPETSYMEKTKKRLGQLSWQRLQEKHSVNFAEFHTESTHLCGDAVAVDVPLAVSHHHVPALQEAEAGVGHRLPGPGLGQVSPGEEPFLLPVIRRY